MSRIHIRFIKGIESDCCATYRVESSDFNDNHINEPIARITINLLIQRTMTLNL